jgi:hypothetical protein
VYHYVKNESKHLCSTHENDSSTFPVMTAKTTYSLPLDGQETASLSSSSIAGTPSPREHLPIRPPEDFLLFAIFVQFVAPKWRTWSQAATIARASPSGGR